MGVSVVIRDKVDDFLAGYFVCVCHCYLTASWGFCSNSSCASRFGSSVFSNSFKGYCLSVIQAMNRNDTCMSYTRTLVAEVKQSLNFCSTWKVSFICREGNSATHYLAKFSKNIDNLLSWMEEAPNFLLLSSNRMYRIWHSNAISIALLSKKKL